MEELRFTRWVSQNILRMHSRSIDVWMNSGDGTGVSVGLSGLCTPRLSTICKAISMVSVSKNYFMVNIDNLP
jgi:hypothetical protein